MTVSEKARVLLVPRKREILGLLPATQAELVEATGISQPAVSEHLDDLVSAGLVAFTGCYHPCGGHCRRIYSRIDPEPVIAILNRAIELETV